MQLNIVPFERFSDQDGEEITQYRGNSYFGP